MKSVEQDLIEQLKNQVQQALYYEGSGDFTFVYNTLKDCENLFEILETRKQIMEQQDILIKKYEDYIY